MKKGFTMVELLVVLLIVGILAAVATPIYLANTRRARASEAVATMSLIRQAERDYFVNHEVYFTPTGNLTEPPPVGVGVNVGTAQYFSNAAFSVTANATSTRFADPGVVDFLITANGAGSDACNTTSGTDCAVRATEVAGYDLEMDNSGRIFVNYNNETTADWSQW